MRVCLRAPIAQPAETSIAISAVNHELCARHLTIDNIGALAKMLGVPLKHLVYAEVFSAVEGLPEE